MGYPLRRAIREVDRTPTGPLPRPIRCDSIVHSAAPVHHSRLLGRMTWNGRIARKTIA